MTVGEGTAGAGGADGAAGEQAGPPGRSLKVAWSPTSVAKVRRLIVEDLTTRGVPDDIVDEAEIVCSELLANAVRHARPMPDGSIKVRWKVRGDVVEVEVSDGGGDTFPKAAPRAVWASNGRGLRIVRSMAHEWGVQEDRFGLTVWAALGGPSRRRAH